jgi:hypothetical protein
MKELRQHSRQTSSVSVSIAHPSFATITVKAKDISAGGIAVDMSNHSRPPVGTIVQVTIKRHVGAINEHPLAMRVTHVQANGIVGLAFV